MPEEIDKKKKYEIQFVNLILSLQTTAMQYLGKIMNPQTHKIERNLDQARVTIDMIEMLKEKTKGNLNEEESRMLTTVLSELQMNYVDEITKEEKKEEENK